jgi:hypothetical protein
MRSHHRSSICSSTTSSAAFWIQCREVALDDGASGTVFRLWSIRLRVAGETSGLHGDEDASESQMDLVENSQDVGRGA